MRPPSLGANDRAQAHQAVWVIAAASVAAIAIATTAIEISTRRRT